MKDVYVSCFAAPLGRILGKKTLAHAGAAGKDHLLLESREIKAGELLDLEIVHAGLENAVGKEPQLRRRERWGRIGVWLASGTEIIDA